MNKKRQQHSCKLKATVALSAIKEEMTMAAISKKYKIHPTQIQRWKQQLLEALPDIFSNKANKAGLDKDKEIEELYKSIGQLKVELDWLKKKSGFEY